jgi:hypothetical protein
MLRRVARVRTDVSYERSASIIKMTRSCEPGTTLAVTSNRRTHNSLRSVRRLLVTANVPISLILVTLMMEALLSSETSVLNEPHGVTSQKTDFSNRFEAFTTGTVKNGAIWDLYRLAVVITDVSVTSYC